MRHYEKMICCVECDTAAGFECARDAIVANGGTIFRTCVGDESPFVIEYTALRSLADCIARAQQQKLMQAMAAGATSIQPRRSCI